MQSLIDIVLRQAEFFMNSYHDTPPASILWFKGVDLLVRPFIMRDTNDQDHGSAEENKRYHARKAGLFARMLDADRILFIWPCKGLEIPVGIKLDETLDPETYPEWMCMQMIAVYGIDLKTERVLIEAIAYKLNPFEARKILPEEKLLLSFDMKTAIVEGYNRL